MSSNKEKGRSSRSTSRSRTPSMTPSIPKTPTIAGMENLSRIIEEAMDTSTLTYLVRSANDPLHDIELQADGTHPLHDPMNERTPKDKSDQIIEPPILFDKRDYGIQEEEETDMDSDEEVAVPFMLPRTTDEANDTLRQHCKCNHIMVHEITRNEVFLKVISKCKTKNPILEDTVPEVLENVDYSNTDDTDNALITHLRGVKRTREEYDLLPANAKKVIKEFANGKVPEFTYLDSDTMLLCADYM